MGHSIEYTIVFDNNTHKILDVHLKKLNVLNVVLLLLLLLVYRKKNIIDSDEDKVDFNDVDELFSCIKLLLL